MARSSSLEPAMVNRLRMESAIFEQSEEIVVLPVDVTTDLVIVVSND